MMHDKGAVFEEPEYTPKFMLTRKQQLEASHENWMPRVNPYAEVNERIREAVDRHIQQLAVEEAARQEAIVIDEIRAAAYRYLLDTHASMFSRAFSIDSEAGRQRAVDFIVELFKRVAQVRLDLAEDEARRFAAERLDDYLARVEADRNA